MRRVTAVYRKKGDVSDYHTGAVAPTAWKCKLDLDVQFITLTASFRGITCCQKSGRKPLRVRGPISQKLELDLRSRREEQGLHENPASLGAVHSKFDGVGFSTALQAVTLFSD